MKILAISGSTRSASYNTKLLHVIQKIAVGVEVEVITLNNIPIFNQDLESSLPAEVMELKKKARMADAILIATPEYNHMIPGALKNAIEWMTRDSGNVLENKWLGIVGCSDGIFGTARAQVQLMTLGLIVGMKVAGKFRFYVPRAQDKFNEQGDITDPETMERLTAFVQKYTDFLHKELHV